MTTADADGVAGVAETAMTDGSLDPGAPIAPAPAPPAAAPRPPAPVPRRPGHGGTAALTWLAALTVFAVVLIVLAWRMLGGNDPALGAGQSEQGAVTPAARVIVRRVIRRRIVITTDAPAGTGPVPAVGGATTGGSAPVSVSAAPPGARAGRGARRGSCPRARDEVLLMLATFTCMGCEMSLWLGDQADAALIRRAQRWLHAADGCLSRFDPHSELSRLNHDARTTIGASVLLRSAIGAARWAAERSGGLVDPTLLAALTQQGYASSLAGVAPPSLRRALAVAPARRPAQPQPAARWRAIELDDARGTITRPPGLRLDTGASSKGLAADAVAHLLDAHDDYVVDCGGDLRIRAPRRIDVHVEHPLTGAVAHTLRVAEGAVATSGLRRRLWRRPGGGFAHHLLDPSTGEPAWTGLVQATALAPSALAAETLAKTALLSGPPAARRLLSRSGGVLVHDDGTVEPVGRPARRTSLQLVQEEVAA